MRRPFGLLPIVFLTSCCVVISPFLVLIACVSGNEKGAQPARGKSNDYFDVANLADLFAVLGNLENKEDLQRIVSKLPNGDKSAKLSESNQIRQRMETMLSIKLTHQDLSSFRETSSLLKSFHLLRERKYEQVLSETKQLLKSPNLTLQIYKKGFSLHAIASIQIKDQDLVKGTAQLADLSFLEFHNSLCKALCDTPGWEALAEEENNPFTQKQYAQTHVAARNFKLVGLPRPSWLGPLVAEQETGRKSDETADPTVSLLNQLKRIAARGKFQDGLSLAQKTLQSGQSPAACNPEHIFAHHIVAQAQRRVQSRDKFLASQKLLVSQMEFCDALRLEMTPENYLNFKIDAQLWLARLLWEKGFSKEAFASVSKTLAEVEKEKLWDFYLEALQVQIGRTGFEDLSAQENLRLLENAEKVLSQAQFAKGLSWVLYRKGLLLFLSAKFTECADNFKKMAATETSENTRAGSLYWQGRCLRASNPNTPAEETFYRVGQTEPLGIYDNLSGQLLARPSGKVSTDLLSPFEKPWHEELDSWITLKPSEPFLLFQPVKWLQKNLFRRDTLAISSNQLRFEAALRSSLFLATALRATGKFKTFDDYSRFLRESDNPAVELLRSQVIWLKTTYVKQYKESSSLVWTQRPLAWLLHITGDYLQAITFVGELRDKTSLASAENSFLYFIFYPRPFQNELSAASQKCGTDVDLLYAIARQESLFQVAVKSDAGAVGLMQLLPSTAKKVLARFPEFQNGQKINLTDPTINALAGACYLADLLKRYNGNTAYAIAAYNAGEGAVDSWLAKRNKIQDVPFFMEFIPFAETQKYTQRVLRNYFNMKWIYSIPVDEEG
jgi:hypothetical protein